MEGDVARHDHQVLSEVSGGVEAVGSLSREARVTRGFAEADVAIEDACKVVGRAVLSRVLKEHLVAERRASALGHVCKEHSAGAARWRVSVQPLDTLEEVISP